LHVTIEFELIVKLIIKIIKKFTALCDNIVYIIAQCSVFF